MQSHPGQAIPLTFTPDKHVLWKTRLPQGHSSPCVWGDRIFLTGFENTTLIALCVDASSGRVLWEITRTVDEIRTYVHIAGSPANPTPATDGERVVFYFDDYGLIVTDLDGSLLWDNPFPPVGNEYSYGASPVLEAGRIYLNRDGGDDPSLLCLDAIRRRELWKAPRPGAIWGFSTPYLFDGPDGQTVLLGGSGRLDAYNVHTGALVWRLGGFPGFICPSPVATGNLIIYGGWTTAHSSGRRRVESVLDDTENLPPHLLTDPTAFLQHFDRVMDGRLTRDELPRGRLRDSFEFTDSDKNGYLTLEELKSLYSEDQWAPGRNVVLCIRGGGRGDVSDSHRVWEESRGLPYVASPMVYRGRVYLLAAGGFITCVDVETGHHHFLKKRLGEGGEYYATPVAVGDHVLVCAQRGVVFVIEAANQFRVAHKTDLGEAIFATPAVARNTLFVRTEGHLWAFSNQ